MVTGSSTEISNTRRAASLRQYDTHEVDCRFALFPHLLSVGFSGVFPLATVFTRS
jgi:hypothetical protein